MKRNYIAFSLASIFSLCLISYSAYAQMTAIAAPFQSLLEMIKNEYIVFGVLFFLFFILLYSAFLGGLNTIPAFRSEEAGKYSKNAKVVALTLSGITCLSTFFVTRGDILMHAKRIASMFNLFFAVLLSVILFFIVRHTFKGEGDIFGIESKNLMSILSLALSLYVFGTIGNSAWALGMGMSIFTITMIVVIMFAFSGLGGKEEAPAEVGGTPYVSRGIDNVFGEERTNKLRDVAGYIDRATNYTADNGGRARKVQEITTDVTALNQTLTQFMTANNIQARYQRLEGVARANPTPDNQRLQADFAGLINAHTRISRKVAECQRRLTDQNRAGKQAIEATRDTLRGVLERGNRGDIVDRVEELRSALNSDEGSLNDLKRDTSDLASEWGDVQNRVWEHRIAPELQRLGIV